MTVSHVQKEALTLHLDFAQKVDDSFLGASCSSQATSNAKAKPASINNSISRRRPLSKIIKAQGSSPRLDQKATAATSKEQNGKFTTETRPETGRMIPEADIAEDRAGVSFSVMPAYKEQYSFYDHSSCVLVSALPLRKDPP